MLLNKLWSEVTIRRRLPDGPKRSKRGNGDGPQQPIESESPSRAKKTCSGRTVSEPVASRTSIKRVRSANWTPQFLLMNPKSKLVDCDLNVGHQTIRL